MFECHDKYFKTINGFLKISSLISCLLGFICLASSSVQLHNARACFFSIVVWLTFMYNAIVLVINLFELKLPNQITSSHLNANKCQSYLHGFLAVICFIAAAITNSLDMVAYTMATFFGLLVFSFNAYDAYLYYRLSCQCHVQTQTEFVNI